MDLEKQIKFLKEEATRERTEGMEALDSVFGKGAGGDSLPWEPAKYTLQGHRGKVNKLVLHPYYNLAASASEDATIRLWNFEEGEQERTLKSHTGIVNYLAFN